MARINAFTSVDDNLLKWMRDIRRNLHQYPELSFNEHRTSSYIQDRLTALGVGYCAGWGGTGVIANLGNKDETTSHVGLRADMDALPVEEKN